MPHEGEERFGEGVEEVGLRVWGDQDSYLSALWKAFSIHFPGVHLRALRNILLILTEGDNKEYVCLSQAISKATDLGA